MRWFASKSVPRHLTRGAIGFLLIAAGFALVAVVGPVSLLLVPAGLVALRGCPMCWTVGLIATISDARIERSCSGRGCALGYRSPAKQAPSGDAHRMR